MNRRTLKRWLQCAPLVLALAACGGGGGGSDSGGGIDGTGGGGIDGTGMAFGTITGFGSVFVNGIEFSTSSSTIKLDDSNVTQAELRVGMVVRVDGSIDNKQAATITVDDAVKGRVEQVLDASRLVVMGQTVLIDNQTRVANGAPSINDYVEVHGLPSADGVVTAGYIERKATPATPPFAVKGFVKNHDTAAKTFAVGALTVNYSGAAINDMPAGSWNGLVIDAKGSTCASQPVCGTLAASKVEPGGAVVANIAKAEVEGFVSSVSANGFVIGSQTVATSAGTVFEGGLAADLVVGSKVEAEGPISNGVLNAVKVSLRDSVRFEADVASVNTSAGTLTLAGLPGITVQVNALTEFKNGGSLAGLTAPNHLRIKARPGANNSVLALELEVRSVSSDSRLILQGPVGSVSGTTSLAILGVTVDTTTIAESEFKNHSDASIGRAAFFAAATPGTIVKARADRRSGANVWDQIELED
jgi:Domain of unknown function (DUF5666)